MATKTLKARYKNGVLTLLEKVDLPEDVEMTVRVEVPEERPYEERLRRFRATAGAWRDAYDWDAFLEETYRERDRDARAEVEL